MPENLNYTVINHNARIKLGLSMNEYAIADLIYHLSNNPDSAYSGWCYASKNRIAEMLSMTKRNVLNIIDRLVELKLIERHEVTKHLRSTKHWYDNVIMKTGEKNSPVVKKDHLTGEKNSPRVVKKIHPTNIYNKDIYNSVNGNKNTQDENQEPVTPQNLGQPPTLEEKNKSWLYELPDLNIEDGEKNYMVQEILAVCGDEQSKDYYRLVASKIQPNVIIEKLAEIKADGAINKGALFVHKIEVHTKSQRMSMPDASVFVGA